MIDVLDNSASVHAPRNLNAGARSVNASYMAAQAPLTELQKAKAADNVDAMLFISRSGVVTYLDANHRGSVPYNTIQATFGDGVGELSYLDLTVDYSDANIYNEVDATKEASSVAEAAVPATQTASDATSKSAYFDRIMTLSPLPVTTNADASTIATAMLAKYKDPMYRIQSMTLTAATPDVALNAFERDIGDKIRVLRTPPGGGARVQQDLWIQSIDISGTPSAPVSIKFGLSPV